MEIVEMIGTDVVREIMKEKGITHKMFAEMLGYKGQSGVTGRLGTRKIGLDKLVEMLNALGYEVVVRKSGVPDSDNEVEWLVIG